MGIHGIYKEIGPGKRIALSKLALEKFEDTGRPLRIAIDTSIWLFQIQASKGGTNPALRTFYYRLLRLIALSIHPVFVFDGPNKPPFKRNKRTGPNVASIPEFLAKQLLKQFGYPIHLAPGEAEAECALLQREGIVDAVLSEDVDTLMFGSGITIRNWSPEKAGNTPTHVNVYDAVETKNGPSGLDREGMILVALMSGGDYVPEGIPGCGPKTACEAAKAGFGRDLCRIPTADKRAMAEWRQRLQHELKTNESKLFRRKHGTLKIPEDFPRLDILGYYTHPAISSQAGLDKLRRSINWDQGLDFPGLRDFTHDAFDWVKLEGAKHFIRSLAPSLLVRQLRLRSKDLDRLPRDNVQAIQEDEALLVKGIHGKRQHPVTDNCVELRVSFTPIELVTIDLSQEEPDDVPDEPPPGSQAAEVDLEDEASGLEDDAPKKRGPTKFDPYKPARIWVMESIVKVGVPLKAQDWEAERQSKSKPRRAATVQEPVTSGPKATKAKRTRTAGDMPQAPINRFAKVTKPGSQLARASAKTQAAPTSRSTPLEAIDLLSSSPEAPRTTATVPPRARQKSPSPVFPELPSSVTKRRVRGPMQRSHTLPANPSIPPRRSKSPPVVHAVDTLDLLSSPIRPLSTQMPARRARAPPKTDQITRVPRSASVSNSPSKTRQTTLDTWRASATPTKPRDDPPTQTAPIPTPPELRTAHNELDELDLTLSSPTRSSRAKPQSERCTASRRTAAVSRSRPPLTSISSNSSSISADSNTSKPARRKNSRTAETAALTRRTSPRLRKTKSVSAEPETLILLSSPPLAAQKPLPVVESLDLSCLSSPIPPDGLRTKHVPVSTLPASPPRAQPTAACRRSPRNHTSASPPAAWKSREQRKRQIILRKSVAGAWDLVDADSPQKVDAGQVEVLKGKERRKWRESEVDFLDLS